MTTFTHSAEVQEIAAALAKAQGEIENAKKDVANTFFKSKYADLASVWDAVRAPLSKHGIAVVQVPCAEGVHVGVDTMLVHTSGQWLRGVLIVTAKDDGPQAVGSAITYLRRYALQSFTGVAPEDDDAERAEGRQDGKAVEPAKVVTEATETFVAVIDKVSDWTETGKQHIKRRAFQLEDGRKVGIINMPPKNEKLGDLAAQLAHEGNPVEITVRRSQFGLDLVSVKRIGPPAEPTQAISASDIPF